MLKPMNKLKLVNYTSEVPAARSIMEIEELLFKAGATNISKSATGGMVEAIIFALPVGPEYQVFRLPINVGAVQRVLRETKSHHPKDKHQAERVAWRILKDWVQIQVAMIQLEQAQALEVFLPYLWNGKQTFFQSWSAGLALPSGVDHES